MVDVSISSYLNAVCSLAERIHTGRRSPGRKYTAFMRRIMKHKNIHKWDLTPKEAIRVQYRIREMYVKKKLPDKRIRYIAGVDVSVKGDTSKAAVVVLTYPGLEEIEAVTFETKTSFPYVPGLLSFREGPVVLECVKKLSIEPDLFMFDGQGLAHPRKTGLATHIGILMDKPSIGVAKSHLYGSYKAPGMRKGSSSLLKDKDGSAIGAVLRTRDNTKPVYVSPGHLIDIDSSIRIVLACSPRYKIPEPTRAAHRIASLAA